MPDNIQKYRDEAVTILREDYPEIIKGIHRLEVFMRFQSKKAVYELRDFLFHLSSLFRDDLSESEAVVHINECHTHLRRCAVEPLEYQAEKRFVKLDFYVRLFAKFPFIRNNPTTKPEFFESMKKIQMLISEGRTVKTEGRACALMDEAFCLATDLLSQVNPTSFLIQAIFWLIGVFISGGIAGYLASKF